MNRQNAENDLYYKVRQPGKCTPPKPALASFGRTQANHRKACGLQQIFYVIKIGTSKTRSDLAAELGFEPRQYESESQVLPLHHSATTNCIIRTFGRKVNSHRAVCFPVYNPPLLGRWVSYLAFSAIPLNRGRPGVLRPNSNSQCKTVGF